MCSDTRHAVRPRVGQQTLAHIVEGHPEIPAFIELTPNQYYELPSNLPGQQRDTVLL